MRNSFLSFIAASWVLTGIAGAQTGAAAPTTVQLTVNDAVRMALEHNVDLAADRLDPQISDTLVAAAVGAFRPSFNTSLQRNNQLQPPSNFLIPAPTQTDVVTSTVGISQRLERFGTSYSIGWTANHTDGNSVLNTYNPLLQSGFSMSVSQPLLRDFRTDSARQLLLTSRIGRDIADTRLRESLVHTTAAVKTAYWNLAAAIANVTARRSALELAEELARVNKVKVDVGQSPSLDLVTAQAEVAANQEQLIIAETAVREAEDRLRMLIYDATDPAVWTIRIEPTDAPPLATITPDINGAVQAAIKERADLERARKDIDTSVVNIKSADNARLPDVRLNVGYVANGLGGTQLLRAGDFPGTVVGPGSVIGFGDVLRQVFTKDYPTWSAGVSVSYPIGRSTEDANYARTRLEEQQAAQRLKAAEVQAIQQVRNAGWRIEMNAQRMQTTRVARELAEQRLDAERKRFEVGMSTNFLVVQAQRDLAQAKQNELAAVLAHGLSLVEFEALQQAGPPGSNGGENAAARQASQGQAPSTSASPAGTQAGTGITGPAGLTIPGF